MATWKKVIVSGSNLSQLNNDANYLVDAQDGAVLSGSFSGSFQGDGSNLTGVVATVSNALTDGNGIVDFSYDGSSAGVTVAVEVSGSTLSVDAGGVKVADAGITATQLASSVAGDGLAGGAGTALSVNVDDSSIEISSDTLQVKAGGVTNAMLANSGSTIGSTLVSLGATVTTIDGLTLTGAVGSGSFSGSFVGDGSGLTGLVSTLDVSGSTGNGSVDLLTQDFTIQGTSNEVDTSMSGQTLTIGLPDDVTIGQDLTVTRNLVVQGTASFQHETNLDVADRFIRLASGSSANGDGGIVIQQDSAANGEAFAFDTATTRWGVTGSFDASTNTVAPDAFMAAVVVGTSADPADAPARYQAAGNIFVGNDQEIYIYS